MDGVSVDIESLIHPLSVETFMQKVVNGESFVVEGGDDKFAHLISLEEIEARLNDGCNTAMPVHIVEHGARHPILEERVLWSPVATKKREVLSLLKSGHSFMMTNMTQINGRVAELIDNIEDFFVNAHADLHLYVSTHNDASGYDAHRDRPQHKIYLQMMGVTHWKIFRHRSDLPDEVDHLEQDHEEEYLRLHMEFDLRPGDLLYVPPNVFHKVRNHEGPRVSFSIPFTILAEDSNMKRMDRTYIPFAKLFLDGA